jgi:hypothetical protein
LQRNPNCTYRSCSNNSKLNSAMRHEHLAQIMHVKRRYLRRSRRACCGGCSCQAGGESRRRRQDWT